MATLLALVCAKCGKSFTKNLGDIRPNSKEYYCTKSCQDSRKSIPLTELKAAYLDGYTLQSLSTRYGVSPSTISNRLRANGVPLRKSESDSFRVPYRGYWNDWGNVEKHLRELISQHGGVLPGKYSFEVAGLGSLYVTLQTRWGGLRKVRMTLGLGGLKLCTVCNKAKDKYTEFRLKRKKGEQYYDSVCKACSSHLVESYRHTWEGRAAELVRRAKDRSSKFGLEFDLDQPWVYERLLRNDFKCEVTGIPLSRGRDGGGVGFANRYAASLDRVDSSLGYTKSNVRVVCNRINTALGDLSDDQFEEFAKGFLLKRGFKVEKC